MTRQEAMTELWSLAFVNTQAKVDVDDLLCRIYDDFENRTCSSCSHCRADFEMGDGVYQCDNGIATFASDYGDFIELDFGCNKWVEKQND